jgi:predicted nucleotidyltransferase
MKSKKKTLSKEILQEIVRRVVEVAKPEKIILFGSAARGKMGPNSDVDLLVVKKGKYNRSRLSGDIYMNLHGVGHAVDVIVVTPEDVERYRNTHCLIIKLALQEGREVYRAQTLLSQRVAEPSKNRSLQQYYGRR